MDPNLGLTAPYDDWPEREEYCRTCGQMYDGGQCCTYCGDPNPTDDPDAEAYQEQLEEVYLGVD